MFNSLLVGWQPSEYPLAGGIIDAYSAECCYFKSYHSQDIVRLIESKVAMNSFDLDLSDCPLVCCC